MKLLIDQLIVLDRAFYRYYLEMLLTLEHTHALTPWQMSILLWRAKIFHVENPLSGTAAYQHRQ